MNKLEFDNFFKVHSQNVDNSNLLGFWRLTDEIMMDFLLKNMPQRKNVVVVDFGGGTGRWLQKLDQYFTDSKFIIADLSEDMLAQARKKIENNCYSNDITVVNCDIAVAKGIDDACADYVISTYNPLSFVAEPQNMIDQAFRVLKTGGTAMITIQGYYNALYSKLNNYLADANELRRIFKTKKVKWNDSVPELWQLSKSDMESMFEKAGFVNINSKGIACITQPQPEDFDPENKQLGALSKKMNDDAEFFATLLEIEIAAGNDPNAVDRGMNIMTIGTKQ